MFLFVCGIFTDKFLFVSAKEQKKAEARKWSYRGVGEKYDASKILPPLLQVTVYIKYLVYSGKFDYVGLSNGEN